MGQALSRMIVVVESENLIKGFCLVSNVLVMSHLQFADDTLIFYAVEEVQIKSIKAILLCFIAVRF